MAKSFEEMLEEVEAITRYHGSPLYCFYIGDDGKIEFRHLTRDDLFDYDEGDFIQNSFGVAMFETKAEGLKYLSEEQPALLKLTQGSAEDFIDK
jgi:hypothetical protein